MKVSEAISATGKSIKSIIKLAMLSRKSDIPTISDPKELVILANGPSLNKTLETYSSVLEDKALLSLNFAANSDIFPALKPEYYVLADPHFFENNDDANVNRLYSNILAADWDMTLFVPVKYADDVKAKFALNRHISVRKFNFLAVEGWEWLENFAFSHKRGMPRPRNVLIPSIMIAIAMGYKTIYLTGADHSWTKTLDVTEDNVVVSIQPHFYTEDKNETQRIATEYRGHRLDSILESFMIAFRSYFTIKRFADKKGIEIYNSTPGSFIDAFPRKSLR